MQNNVTIQLLFFCQQKYLVCECVCVCMPENFFNSTLVLHFRLLSGDNYSPQNISSEFSDKVFPFDDDFVPLFSFFTQIIHVALETEMHLGSEKYVPGFNV